MTSLVARHCTPCRAALVPDGEQAGGVGVGALTGLLLEPACAAGSGSSGPFGFPGKVGCLNVNVAGWPLIRTELTVMFGPGTVVLVIVFERSKSRLNSLRHCVAVCARSTWVPGRNRFVCAS